MNRRLYLLMPIWLCALTSVVAAEVPKITNDSEHDAIYHRGTNLISPHVNTSERIPKQTEATKAELREGIAYLGAVTAYNPRNWAAFWFSGKASQALGDDAGANASFKAAYELQPNNPDVVREYALSCIERGFGTEAVQATKHAIALSPRDAGLYANLALAHLISNQNREALTAIRAALDINPNDRISLRVKDIVRDVSAGRRPQPTKGADFIQ